MGVQSGVTALLLASENGHPAIVEALVTAGAEVNLQTEVCTSLQPSAQPLTVSAVCVAVRGDRARHGGGGDRQVVRGSPGTC